MKTVDQLQVGERGWVSLHEFLTDRGGVHLIYRGAPMISRKSDECSMLLELREDGLHATIFEDVEWKSIRPPSLASNPSYLPILSIDRGVGTVGPRL